MADEPLDPQEVLEAAEAAHLAARRTVPITPGERAGRPERADRPEYAEQRDARGAEPAGPVAPDQQQTTRLEPGKRAPEPTVRSDRQTAGGPQGGSTAAAGTATGVRARAPLPLAALVAAGWAAVVSFVPVAVVVTLLVLAELGPSGLAGPVRVAAAGWLLGHGVPLDTPDGTLTLAPLALAALAAWRVARAGVHVTRAIGGRGRRSLGQAAAAAAAVALAYGGIGALMGMVAGGAGWGSSVSRAGLTLAGFGLVAAGYGALRATGLLADWSARLPLAVPYGLRAGLAAVALVLAAGAALAGVAVAASGGAAADLLAAYDTDVAGQAGLTLLCLAYAPNLAGWAAAYLVGPGFAVGADTVVRSSEVAVGPLPVLPVFVGLPDGPLPTVGALLLLVPVVAGAAGWLLPGDIDRRAPTRRVAGWGSRTLAGLVSGVVAATVLGLLAVAAGGGLGSGQLADFGAAPLPVALVSAATVTAGALLGAVTGALLARRHRR